MIPSDEELEHWENILAAEGMPADLTRKRDFHGSLYELPVAPTTLFIGTPLGEAEAEEPWLRDLVVDMVEELDDEQRTCLTLSLYGRHSVREIERITGISKSTAAVRIQEAHDILKARLLQDRRIKRKLYGEGRPGQVGCANRAMECRAGTCERDDCPKCDCIPGSLAEILGRQEAGDSIVLLDNPRPRRA